jgi:hypothetical protein
VTASDKRPPPRAEAIIFADLAALCALPGFAEAIAVICARENIIRVGDGLTGETLSQMYSYERLIRTEISTLIGLLVRHPVDEAPPPPDVVPDYIARAEQLFCELHDALSQPWREGFREIADGKLFDVDLESGAALREPFFYTGESAFSFQYRDFAVRRYSADDAWLRTNRGVNTALVRDVVAALGQLQVRKIVPTLAAREANPVAPPLLLPAFAFTVEEVAGAVRTSPERVRPVLEAFALPEGDRNPRFKGVQDFNATNATPLLRLAGDRYLLYQPYSLAEATYESPAFWMADDKAYASTAAQHRGAYPEQFARACLEGVFGKAVVHMNALLPAGRKARRGEIDVLVVFGDHALVLQIKSKRLTLAARQGADLNIRADFQAAIQDACDQARDCSLALLEGHELRTSDGKALRLPTRIKRVFPVCLVADHYPALAAQVRRFLKWTPADGVATPIVTDLFALDALTEMLGTPLRVLNYLSLRDRFANRVIFNHELVLLGFHLKQNLWIDGDYDQVLLEDDIGADLDAAMAVRRDGAPGPRTPPGALTRLIDTPLSRLIAQIERNPAAVELGLFLLQMGEDSHRSLGDAVAYIVASARRDGRSHDFGTAILGTGVTIHANDLPEDTARERLEAHCRLKKHQQRAEVWYGVLIDAKTGALRSALRLDDPWEPDEALDEASTWLRTEPTPRHEISRLKLPKPRPNELCFCGSGRKYKKCCRP